MISLHRVDWWIYPWNISTTDINSVKSSDSSSVATQKFPKTCQKTCQTIVKKHEHKQEKHAKTVVEKHENKQKTAKIITQK